MQDGLLLCLTGESERIFYWAAEGTAAVNAVPVNHERAATCWDAQPDDRQSLHEPHWTVPAVTATRRLDATARRLPARYPAAAGRSQHDVRRN